MIHSLVNTTSVKLTLFFSVDTICIARQCRCAQGKDRVNTWILSQSPWEHVPRWPPEEDAVALRPSGPISCSVLKMLRQNMIFVGRQSTR